MLLSKIIVNEKLPVAFRNAIISFYSEGRERDGKLQQLQAYFIDSWQMENINKSIGIEAQIHFT